MRSAFSSTASSASVAACSPSRRLAAVSSSLWKRSHSSSRRPSAAASRRAASWRRSSESRAYCAVLREQPAVSGYGVERRGAELLRGENQVLVLGVYVDQAGAEFAQLRELDRNVVDEGAALAGRGYHARNVRFGSIVEVVLVEERLHTAARKVESTLDHAVARRVFHGRAVVLGSEQQAQSTEQDGFAGSRLTRDDVQVRVQLHFELFDKRVILNRQTT